MLKTFHGSIRSQLSPTIPTLYCLTRYNKATMRRNAQSTIILVFVLFLMAVAIHQPVNAQAGTAADLINAVNQLRKDQGLAPYTVDSYLMSFAQSHSDYMASLGRWTHTRADGTTSNQYGIKENVAVGNDMSVHHCVHVTWADWIHWQTMTGYASGTIGAGVSVADGKVYYTLNVLPQGSSINQPPPVTLVSGTTSQNTQNQPIVVSQIITSTPDPEGAIVHIVQSGDTLWTIAEAYDVPIDQILSNSGISQGTTTVFVGQTLIIQAASDPTPTLPPTDTPEPGTPTPTQPRPTMTPIPTRTPAPTAAPTTPPSALHLALGDGKNIGLGLIIMSGFGLIILIYLGFIKNR